MELTPSESAIFETLEADDSTTVTPSKVAHVEDMAAVNKPIEPSIPALSIAFILSIYL